jgi:hypothetical protein
MMRPPPSLAVSRTVLTGQGPRAHCRPSSQILPDRRGMQRPFRPNESTYLVSTTRRCSGTDADRARSFSITCGTISIACSSSE